MKMLSKILSGAMAMALAAGMSVTAFAADGTATLVPEAGKNAQQTADVTIKATVKELGAVYSVNVAWTDLVFDYTESAPASWDTTEHKTVASTGTWTADGNGSVTVTNHSNENVYAKITYAEGGDYTNEVSAKGVTVTATPVDAVTELSKGTLANKTAITEGGASAGQNQIKATVKVEGAPTANITSVTAGTFTAVVGTTSSLD